MSIVKAVDVFIERSLHLLETNPSSTRISITYGSQSKKITKKLKGKQLSKPIEDKSFVSFKVFDPHSGELHKLKSHKSKDLSKILTALGPHGVQISKPSKKSRKPKQTVNEIDQDGDLQVEDEKAGNAATTSIPIRGFSSILANADIKEDEPEAQKPTEATAGSSNSGAGAKKKSKKKGKR